MPVSQRCTVNTVILLTLCKLNMGFTNLSELFKACVHYCTPWIPVILPVNSSRILYIFQVHLKRHPVAFIKKPHFTFPSVVSCLVLYVSQFCIFQHVFFPDCLDSLDVYKSWVRNQPRNRKPFSNLSCHHEKGFDLGMMCE